MSITTLRIKKEYKDRLEVAVKWYSLISILNDFHLPPMYIRLLAFAAIEGNLSSGGKKEKFISIYNSSKNSISNAICELNKMHFLVKEGRKIKINPQLYMDFNNDILVQLNITSSEPKG